MQTPITDPVTAVQAQFRVVHGVSVGEPDAGLDERHVLEPPQLNVAQQSANRPANNFNGIEK